MACETVEQNQDGAALGEEKAATVTVNAMVEIAAPAGSENREDDEATTGAQPPCRKVGPNLENLQVANAGVRKASPLRGGAAKHCAAPGQLGSNDDVIYFCFTVADDGATWTYLENQRPPKRRGWVRNDQLRVNRVGTRGSTFYCGF